MLNILTLTTLLMSASVFAQTTPYQVTPKADGTSEVLFSVGYTLGTHNGSAGKVDGTVQLGQNPFLISSAEISVPLNQLNTGNVKRDCHMFESIGLDYAVSAYPAAQVCDGSDSIPKSGNDSIAFPTLKFSLVSLLDSNSKDPLVPGVAKQVNFAGTFEMHGVKNTIQVPVTLTLIAGTPNKISIKGDFDLLLSDYGIVVRKFLFVTVYNQAHVNLDLELTEQQK